MANISDLDKFLTRFGKAIARNANRIERAALKVAEAELKARVFTDGKATNGQDIGRYSTKPIYINPTKKPQVLPSPSSVRPKGKNGKSKFKNGKQKKTRYFGGGWKEVRQNQGRRTDKVDLQMKDDLFRNIQIALTPSGDNALGFISDKEAKKAKGNEKRFNKTIFALSNAENKEVNKAIIREVDAIIRKL